MTSTTIVANTQITNAAQSGPRSVFSTKAYHRPDNLVKCTFTDGYTDEVPRLAAMQMVQMQALTEEYRKEISELQIQMSQLISSTRTHLNMENSAAPHKQKTVNFRDTFSMQYLPETNLTVHEQSAALNANKQREAARNANAQREAVLKANAQREATLNATKQRDSELNADARPYRPQCAPVQTHATWQPQANLPEWREPGGANRVHRKADTRLEPAHSNTLRT